MDQNPSKWVKLEWNFSTFPIELIELIELIEPINPTWRTGHRKTEQRIVFKWRQLIGISAKFIDKTVYSKQGKRRPVTGTTFYLKEDWTDTPFNKTVFPDSHIYGVRLLQYGENNTMARFRDAKLTSVERKSRPHSTLKIELAVNIFPRFRFFHVSNQFEMAAI